MAGFCMFRYTNRIQQLFCELFFSAVKVRTVALQKKHLVEMSWDYFMKLVASAGAVVGLLVGILAIFKATRDFLASVWRGLRPAMKLVLSAASLVLPNALIVGFLLYRVAIYYFEAGSLDLIVTNSNLFISLVAIQAFLVSLYSFLWAIFVYPRIRKWVC